MSHCFLSRFKVQKYLKALFSTTLRSYCVLSFLSFSDWTSNMQNTCILGVYHIFYEFQVQYYIGKHPT